MKKEEIRKLLIDFVKFYHGVPINDWSMEQIEEYLEQKK